MAKQERKVSSEQAREVANIIGQQLGGIGRLQAFIGAYDFLALDRKGGGLGFKFKGSRKANYIEIIYNDGMDLYEVKFIKMSKVLDKELAKHGLKIYDDKIATVAEYTDVYNDSLMDLFEHNTGLYLTLTPRN